MESRILLRPAVTGWRLNHLLAPLLAPYVQRVKAAGYSAATKDAHIDALLQFSQWLKERHPPADRLDPACIARFFVPGKRRGSAPQRTHSESHAFVHLRAVLREHGLLAEAPPQRGAIPDELDRYHEHMRDICGLMPGTCKGRLHIAERFLRFSFGKGAAVFARLKPSDVRDFIAAEQDRVKTTSHAATLAGGLRQYLRYRSTRGDAVQSLTSVIASPARWHLASLPRALPPGDVERVLASFGNGTRLRAPLRAYAIVRLAADLGLRTIDINRLQLSDIDWQSGSLTLRNSKGRRTDCLPLPATTGRAIAVYLQHERPKTTDRAVFVRHLAPHNEPMGVCGIRRPISDAFRRIGLSHGRTHALRHAFACNLVDRGASIKEVADMLRHRSLDTTLVYAKLDQRRMAAVALPWPRRAS